MKLINVIVNKNIKNKKKKDKSTKYDDCWYGWYTVMS